MKLPQNNWSRRELKIKGIRIIRMEIKFNKKRIKSKWLGIKLKNKIQLKKIKAK